MNSKPTCSKITKTIIQTAFVLVVLMGIFPDTHAQLALERDINRQPSSSLPADLIELDGYLYFSADDGIHGTELYRYHLASGMAELAADIRPYDDSSSPTEITPFDGKVFFRGLDGIGTTPYLLVYDPDVGSVSRLRDTNGQLVREPSNLFVFNEQLFFQATFTGAGREPGYYDPNTDEVHMLADINPSGNSSPSSFLEIDGKLWFSAHDGQSDSRLWHYDPETEALTHVIYESPAGVYPSINMMYHAGGKIFFRGHVSGQGDELRVYDIETNTLLDIPELYPGPASSTPGPFHAYEGKVYFTARTQAYGREVMVFDPADNSVSLLHNINPSGNSNAEGLVTLDNTLYLTANDGLSEERKLFSYNSDSGLAELAGLDNEGNPNLLNILIVANEKLFLYGHTPDTGTELFSYTPGDTEIRLAADINQTTIGSFPYQFTEYNGRLYFGAEEPFTGQETWVYDPTTGQTSMLSAAPGNTGPYGFTVLDDKLIFAGVYPDLGYGLLYYDDSERKIFPTSFITPGHTGHISEIIAYHDKLYFIGRGEDGNDLFVYDPQTEVAVVAAEINPGGNGSPANLFVFNNRLFFGADDGTSGSELWQYDDATGVASMVADINPGNGWAMPDWFAEYDGELYFSAYADGSAYNLYSYDPVNDTVTQRTDISGNLQPEYLTVYDDKLFFKGRLPASGGAALLYYDAATREVEATPQINSRGSNPSWLTVFNNKLYFAATTEAYGNELWEYTVDNGPAIVADIRPGVPGSDPSWLTVFNDKLYFSANDGIRGAEVWSLAACLNLFADVEPVYHPDSLGSIQLTIEGGTPPYNISWSHGSTLQDQENLPPGEYTVVVSDDTGCLSELTLEVRYIDTTSAPELVQQNHPITLFPNPSDGRFTLHWQHQTTVEEIRVFNMQGRQVLHHIPDNHQPSVQISLSHDKGGMYFLLIKSDQGPVYKKVVVQ